METDATVDPLRYLRIPPVDVPTAIALVASLITAAPDELCASAQRALGVLSSSRDALLEVWVAWQRTSGGYPRSVARAVDQCWTAMVRRVELHHTLPPDRSPLREVAQLVLDTIAPDGFEVIKAPHHAKWAHMRTRMDTLCKRGLYEDLETLAGAEFVSAFNACFVEFGRVLHITEAHAQAEALPDPSEPLRVVLQKVSDYVLQLLATVDRDDPATGRAVCRALKPIDDLRQAAAHAHGAADEAPSPTTRQPGPRSAAPAPKHKPSEAGAKHKAAPKSVAPAPKSVPPQRPSGAPPAIN